MYFEELNLFDSVLMQTLILQWRRLGKIPTVLPHFKVVSLRFYTNNSFDNSKYKQKIQVLQQKISEVSEVQTNLVTLTAAYTRINFIFRRYCIISLQYKGKFVSILYSARAKE